MELIEKNWEWIASNPWGSIGLTILCIALGWGAARLFYQERLEILKERRSSNSSHKALDKFKYVEHGRSGKNILSNSHTSVAIDERVSLRAEIPNESKLHIEMKGPKPTTLSDTGASWFYSVGKSINWTANDYEKPSGGRQSFHAEGGVADKELHFARAGEVEIIAYEGNSQTVTWRKVLNIRNKNA
jgi:hypothetical protein